MLIAPLLSGCACDSSETESAPPELPSSVCGDGVCEGSETPSSCCFDCEPDASDRSLLFSQARELSWPPPSYADGLFGAESNPTGDPIGGFYCYRRIVRPSDADFVVSDAASLLAALAVVQQGEVIYVEDDAVIDLTGTWFIDVPGGITIASGRGRRFSEGALIRNLEQVMGPGSARDLFVIAGPRTRLTGLRIEGPGKTTEAARHAAIFYEARPDLENAYYEMGTGHGIYSEMPLLEVDNCEIFGWRTGGIYLSRGAENAFIHHNSIHHCVHAGLGYGVVLGYSDEDYPISALIEANWFDRNRHSVASTGNPYSSYEARYNLIGVEETQQSFDRHQNEGWGGDYTILHHNTARYDRDSKPAVAISGVHGPYVTDGVQVYNNWFYNARLSAAVVTSGPNSVVVDNFLDIHPPPGAALPVAVLSTTTDTVAVGAPVELSAAESSVASGALSYVVWDFGDRSPRAFGLPDETKEHRYAEPGRYLVTVDVVDARGVFSSVSQPIVVVPDEPGRVVLSFWQRDSYQGSASGYFRKKAMIDDVVVWQRDIHDDDEEWHHVVVDVTEHVRDSSTLRFEIESLQDFVAPPYPEPHPFESFEVYLDDIYVSNREYGVEGFSDFEDTSFGGEYFVDAEGEEHWGYGAVYLFETGDPFWEGAATHDSRVSGKRAFRFDARYRMSSTAGSVRGIQQEIRAPRAQPLLDIVSFGRGFVDRSDGVAPVAWGGTTDADGNDVLDFFGYSKRLNGADNYVHVSSFDLAREYVLDVHAWLPHAHREATLIQASNGDATLELRYVPESRLLLRRTSGADPGSEFETLCDVPAFRHDGIGNIVVGTSCAAGNCVLSCASGGVVRPFSIADAPMVLPGSSELFFGGVPSGGSNLYGVLHRARLVHGPLDEDTFSELGRSRLRGAWSFRDVPAGIIEDGSVYGNDVELPAEVTFGADEGRRFVRFTEGGPVLTIAQDASFVVGQQLSIELVARFADMTTRFPIIEGTPFTVINRGLDDGRRVFFSLKSSDTSVNFGDGHAHGWYGAKNLHELEDERWYHFVLTKYDDFLRLYIDGALVRTVYVPGVQYDNSVVSPLLVGGFDGDVSRIAIFDRALGELEVRTRFRSARLGCSDADQDGYGGFPRSGVLNGCASNGLDCDDGNAAIHPGVGACGG